jgi:hypothetical protein
VRGAVRCAALAGRVMAPHGAIARMCVRGALTRPLRHAAGPRGAAGSAQICNMRHATYNARHTTCSVQHATCSMQRAACNVPHATCSMQRAACNVQHATCSMRRAAYNVQHTTCNVRYAAYGDSSSSHGVELAALTQRWLVPEASPNVVSLLVAADLPAHAALVPLGRPEPFHAKHRPAAEGEHPW